MKYFDDLSAETLANLFFRPPEPFFKTGRREILRYALGGLLYIPGDHPQIAQIICSRKVAGLTSLAICLEDAVGEGRRKEAMDNVDRQLTRLDEALADGSLTQDALPLIFVRVANVEMLEQMAPVLIRRSAVVTGVIVPKVTLESLRIGLALTENIHRQCPQPFYLMPILESAELMACSDRISLLQEFRAETDRFYERVLNIRVGATDLSGLYGIRRRRDTPVYQILTVASCIADVVRVFGMGGRYTVSGPVWEYFRPVAQAVSDGQWAEIDGLMREVSLDLQNGLHGKTCAHPAQLLPVQASYVVDWESYQDALSISEGNRTQVGVLSSVRKNKMNELKPHELWAHKTLQRAKLFGVFQPHAGVRELFRAVCGEGAFREV